MQANLTLVKIAAVGGIITCSMGMLLQKTMKDKVRNSGYYTEGFKILRSHRAAVQILGEPIKPGNFDLANENNYYEKLKTHVEVPVKGPNQRGIMYLWAKRASEKDEWDVHRIELGLKNEPDRRLLIKNVSE